MDPWAQDPTVVYSLTEETHPILHYCLRSFSKPIPGGRKLTKQCIGVGDCSACSYKWRPGSQLLQSQTDERNNTPCPSQNRNGVPCDGVLRHHRCNVRYTVKISHARMPTIVTCNASHNHARPPVAGTRLSADEEARFLAVMNANPSATPEQLTRGRNPDSAAPPEQGGHLSDISPTLSNPRRTRNAMRAARGNSNTGTGASNDEVAAFQFQRNYPLNVLVNRGVSLLDSSRFFAWSATEFRETVLGLIRAYEEYDIGSTLAADMTFDKVRDSNVISLTCFDYLIVREVPLVAALVPKRKDTMIYFEFWMLIFLAIPELLVFRNNEWNLSVPGITVDFDQAQSAGFAMAVGYTALRYRRDYPPSSLDNDGLLAYNERAKQEGHDVALRSLRPCDYHYDQAVVREGRTIPNSRERRDFESKCMSLKQLDLTVERFFEIITEISNTFPGHVNWLSYWTRTALARCIFPCLREIELSSFLQRATTISRTENIHSLYAEASNSRGAPWSTFLNHLQVLDRGFDACRQAVIQGEVSIQRSQPPTVNSLPQRIRSHGVLARTAESEPTAEAILALPGRLSTHRSFRRFARSLETEFNGADDLGGLQRVAVSFH